MKILKRILLIIVILIAIPLIVALFVKKDFHNQSEIVINKPKQEVYNYIKFVDNQRKFGKWQLSDPDMIITPEGTDGTVGYKQTWKSKKMSDGSQQISKLTEGEGMETKLDFGFGEPSTCFFILKEISPTQTSVTWGISGKSPYPWNFMSLFMNMDNDFKEGLENLKRVMEKQ